jgi:hypothetical protein
MTQPPTTLLGLPNDILLIIIDYFDQRDLLEIARVAKFISSTSIQKLWHRPRCKTPLALKLILTTLNKSTSTILHPYHDWLIGLDICLNTMQSLSDTIFTSQQLISRQNINLHIKSLRLANVQATVKTSQFLIDYFISPCIKEIKLSNCSIEVTSSLITTQHQRIYDKLDRICIQDCYITDAWVRQIVSSTPQLRHFSTLRSGYLSDTSMVAITQHCPRIETVIVTLPSHLVQSNTITFDSLQLLSNCMHLKKFVCRGQVRISNDICQDWLYSHCPKLEHVDLSF